MIGITPTNVPQPISVDSLQASVPYLKKIFDSDKFGFKKLKIKVFEINYEKFHE